MDTLADYQLYDKLRSIRNEHTSPNIPPPQITPPSKTPSITHYSNINIKSTTPLPRNILPRIHNDMDLIYDIGFIIGASCVTYKVGQLLYYSTKKIYNHLPGNFLTNYYKRQQLVLSEKAIKQKLNIPNHQYITTLPNKGMAATDILELQNTYLTRRTSQPNNGKISGISYKFADEEYLEFIMNSYKKFIFSNPLHPDVFPDIRLMEAEIIQMVKILFHGDKDSCGNITSGGAESIILACKAYRNWKNQTNNITNPEIVISESAHAAFHKAAELLQLNLVIVPNNKHSQTINTTILQKYITANTICIVGSAPTYAHGVMDNISELSEIALRHNIGLHVDCGLGGFILPFLSMEGAISIPYDFRLSGVTSISVDTHKYGCCLKGSSAILYRNNSLKEFQYFITKEWNGGLYATPTLAGTRSGSLIATTWSALLYHGVDGYTNIAKDIIQLKNDLVQSLQRLDDIYIIGEPVTSVIAISSNTLDPYDISSHMTNLGWNLNLLHNPKAFHICLTEVHVKKDIKNMFIKDLQASINQAKSNDSALCENQVGLYGMNMHLNDDSILGAIANIYMNTLITIPNI
jgi:sphinganine-1-phosphate aldolase